MRPGQPRQFAHRSYDPNDQQTVLVRTVRTTRERAGKAWRPCAKSPAGRHWFVQTDGRVYCEAPGCGFDADTPDVPL